MAHTVNPNPKHHLPKSLTFERWALVGFKTFDAISRSKNKQKHTPKHTMSTSINSALVLQASRVQQRLALVPHFCWAGWSRRTCSLETNVTQSLPAFFFSRRQLLRRLPQRRFLLHPPCMYVYVYKGYMDICTYASMCIYVHMFICLLASVYIYTCTSSCGYAHVISKKNIYIYTYTYMYVYVNVHVCVYVYIYACICIHTIILFIYTYVCIHVHTLYSFDVGMVQVHNNTHLRRPSSLIPYSPSLELRRTVSPCPHEPGGSPACHCCGCSAPQILEAVGEVTKDEATGMERVEALHSFRDMGAVERLGISVQICMCIHVYIHICFYTYILV